MLVHRRLKQLAGGVERGDLFGGKRECVAHMPRKRKQPVTAICAECGGAFETSRYNARFCPGSTHQQTFNTRQAVRGKTIAILATAWIEGKGGGHAGSHPVAGRAMRELTSIVRGWVDEDRAAGRPSAIGYVEGLLAEGLYIDRRRLK